MNAKETFNLQKIFDEREDSFDEWFDKYKKIVGRFIHIVKDNAEWTDADLKDLIVTQDNHISNNGQGVIYNTANNPEFENIKGKWESDLKPIINEIVKNNDITLKQFEDFRKIFTSCCNSKKIMAANRVLAAFLPNVLTTTVNEDKFYKVEEELKKRLNDYTPPAEHIWSESNKYFIEYCNRKVKFNDPWQSSIFNWILYTYFEWENEQKTKIMEDINAYKLLLQTTHNLIFTGAPGTGKTYLAKQIAKAMGCTDDEIGFVQFHPSYDYTDFVEGLRPIQDENGKVGFKREDGVFKKFCEKAYKNMLDSQKTKQELEEEKSFEAKYNELVEKIENGDIEEFKLKTEGKRLAVVEVSDRNNIILHTPRSDSARNYTVSFNRLSKLAKVYPNIKSLNDITNINDSIRNVIKGCHASSYWAVLKEVYNQSNNSKTVAEQKIERKNFVFIIDEINRGEISKIFGELFFAIDPGYRGEKGKVQTQYQNLITEDEGFCDGFFVPENVYIIGTMNDIDRSVESMDFAFRRRFAFKEIKAEENTEMLKDLGELKDEAIERMNRLNAAISNGLSSAYHIGASYFLKLNNYNGDFGKLWEYHLEGLLREYLRGIQNADSSLEKLKKAYDNEPNPDNGQPQEEN